MRKTFLTLISVVALAFLVACGGGWSNNNHNKNVLAPTAPAGGNSAGFSDSSFKGNYVFAVNGITRGKTLAVAGIFTADGDGNITSGTRDTVYDSGSQSLSEPITGSYSVNQDGRGLVTLNGSSGTVYYLFVLSSPSAGKLFQNGTASESVVVDAIGRLELQTSTSTTLAGSYVVRLDGEDSGKLPYGAVGGLTASGSTLTGSIDENDAGTFSPSLAVSAGSYSLSANGRGTASYATATGPNTAAHNFIVYYVSPSRLELISTDPKFWLHGYADLQTSVDGTVASFIGDQVFNISGSDSRGNPVQETGRFTLSAGSLSNGFADYNDGGLLYTDTPFNGIYTVAPSGRWQATLDYTSFASSLGLVGWQVSPQQSLVLTTSSTQLETGDMRAQTLGLTTIAGEYAEYYSGYNGGSGNLESTGNLLAAGGTLSGFVDEQTDSSGFQGNIPVSGSYTIDPIYGRGSGYIGTKPVAIYTVSADTIYLFSVDSNSLYQGTLTLQTP
jgi:hypothetical protein